MKKVSVIISNTNTKDVIRECLKNLEELVYEKKQNLEIIVVDNNSSDGSADMIKTEFPWVKMLSTPNYGLAYGVNMGAKVASGDYLLFLGEDGFPRESTIPGLVGYMEARPDVGLTTARLIMRDGKPDIDVHRNLPTPWNSFTRLFLLSKIFPKSPIFNNYFMIDKDHSKEHEIEVCITHFMMIPRHVFDEVGGFDDKNYFVFGEDADMCYKIKLAGYKLMYVPQFEAGHYKGASFGTRKETADIAPKPLAWKNFMHYNSTRVMRVFVNKFYRNKYPLPLVWFMNFGSYVLQFQRQLTETAKHIKRHGFKYFSNEYTRDSRRRLKERFGF
ncbi:hypothetical protein A2886_02685 [candidate division WWE3 bacterium RIFCSPHIGHO2_01_FULL_42_13]|uniref:Glycosyltransferase 2-like domain-containing protein n=1 Tax=candidate division WWE3 bacterium RIFCSPHIGHO2_01_FULL_42_13 TaxID=1802617 RepID=A0A1F4URQ8_UNCKA|nr:MAG: hypothetical protein A2886_02685 [candidate division WWE3 bacterium RIFCSPHIGHO2_01_FULL_42_13]